MNATYRDRLKMIRKRLGASQRELAKVMGVSYSLLARWEAGGSAHLEPAPYHARAICLLEMAPKCNARQWRILFKRWPPVKAFCRLVRSKNESH